jgi:hypothetical protein
MSNDTKETVQYFTAIGFLVTGILLCFLSFFLNNYDIKDGVLWYLGQAVIFTGAVFGLNLAIKTKVGQMESRLNERIDKKMKKVDDLIED